MTVSVLEPTLRGTENKIDGPCACTADSSKFVFFGKNTDKRKITKMPLDSHKCMLMKI